MTGSPKATEERMERMLNAWRTLAPAKTFGGMTLAQFEAVAAPAQEARGRLEELDNQQAQAVTERDRADETFEAKAKLVVAGVLGYTRRSEHKSGLHRSRTKNRRPPNLL